MTTTRLITAAPALIAAAAVLLFAAYTTHHWLRTRLNKPPHTPTTYPPAPPPQQTIATALADYWTTADPARPFDINEAADQIETYLTGHGYTITPDTKAHPMKTPTTRATCDASLVGSAGDMGPCILRHHHDGPIHQDTHGATWRRHTPTSRSAIAFSSFLVLACLTATLGALIHHQYGWTVLGTFGICLLGRELTDDVHDYQNRSRT